MINLSILISSSEVNGPGGLFDIGATLPLVVIQFLLLMVILNIILYNPLLTIIEERKEYILTNLGKASEMLAQANNLTTLCEQQLDNARKLAQLQVKNVQQTHKIALESEVKDSQSYIDHLSKIFANDLIETKQDILSNKLSEITGALCDDIQNGFGLYLTDSKK